MMKMRIAGTGKALPSRIVTNADLEKIIDTSDEWIRQRTGVEQRHWVSENEKIGVSDLALEASKKAIKNASWKKADIDLIIFATLSPDYFFPGSGCFLQTKLGVGNIPALDIRQQCTGFLYGISIADAYIKSGHYKKILFACAEIQSTGFDRSKKGRDISVIFGDGAACVCLEAKETNENVGLLSSVLHSDGTFAKDLYTEAPGSLESPRLTKKMLDEGRHFPVMNGNLIFKQAVRKIPEAIYSALKKANMDISEIDLVIPHQANLRINQFVQKTLKMTDDKFVHNIQKYGNTTAATIPIALDESIKNKRIDVKNSNVVFASFGAGATWGASVYKFF